MTTHPRPIEPHAYEPADGLPPDRQDLECRHCGLQTYEPEHPDDYEAPAPPRTKGTVQEDYERWAAPQIRDAGR